MTDKAQKTLAVRAFKRMAHIAVQQLDRPDVEALALAELNIVKITQQAREALNHELTNIEHILANINRI